MESLLRGEVLEAAEGNLDIVPSVYEGGLKVWECSIDLAEYIENHLDIDEETKVLELGCGAGLPGLLACLKGASVDFQDYNKEVLELITIPNAFSNIGSRVKRRCHFFAGDWSALADNIAPGIYDFILTSETIYNTTSYQSLIAVLKKAIKQTGIVGDPGSHFGYTVELIINRDGELTSSPVRCVPPHTSHVFVVADVWYPSASV
ncbi:hypothetical protein HPB50_008326 [Hyalomma asiaticum]|uniref:Uncharacterized protein n=1 Tax=Hyalomma asiaticum TaxID=266040 RepID=A0ACB7SWJ2_HYAAI|nr:hypothetical protein HPB50_008326 [Hyalomma asiaticum]